MLIALTRRIRSSLKDPCETVRQVGGPWTATQYLVWLDPFWYPIVFNRATGKIVTVLPLGAFDTRPTMQFRGD